VPGIFTGSGNVGSRY